MVPACALAAVAWTATAPAAAPQAACGKLVQPTRGMYFGAAPGYANEDAYWPGPESSFDQDAGLKAVWTMFGQWWSDKLPFPTKTVESIWQDGKIPYLRLNPYPYQQLNVNFATGEDPGPYSLQDIAAGKFDAQIRSWADTARNLDIPILAEFGTEVNNYFSWSGISNGAGTTNGYGDPNYPDGAERFRDAYRHLVDVVRGEGANNITWFFHADTSYDAQPWNRLQWYYPGDDYVDWLGLSLYAGPKWNEPGYTSFAEKLQDWHDPTLLGTYADITSLSSRPLAILEMGFNSVPLSLKPAWVTDAAATIKSGRFSRLAGLTWYVTNSSDFNSVITASDELHNAFKAAFDDPFFAAKPQFTGDCRPLAPTKVRLKSGTLSWAPAPNATTYEIWRGGKRVATASGRLTSITVGKKRGPYRVRAVDLAGTGPFATSR